jgi:DNA repair protein RadC
MNEMPELRLLRIALGKLSLARRLAQAPGGWRTLSQPELESLGLTKTEQRRVAALQTLTRRSYPALKRHELASSAEVARVYGERMGGLVHEEIHAVALDCRNRVMGEVRIAKGGGHAACLRPSDVLRPMIRIGASCFLVVHNHPGGSPQPSAEDIDLTRGLALAGGLVGVALVDHVIVGARGGGHVSLFEMGLISSRQGESK